MHPAITFGSSDEALVFFDWLARFNGSDACDQLDDAERRVLFDLEATLEASLPEVLSDRYLELLEAARVRVVQHGEDTQSDG